MNLKFVPLSWLSWYRNVSGNGVLIVVGTLVSCATVYFYSVSITVLESQCINSGSLSFVIGLFREISHDNFGGKSQFVVIIAFSATCVS
jgi:hypothetical protein